MSIWYAVGGVVGLVYLGAWAVVVFELATAPLVDAHYRVISSRPPGSGHIGLARPDARARRLLGSAPGASL